MANQKNKSKSGKKTLPKGKTFTFETKGFLSRQTIRELRASQRSMERSKSYNPVIVSYETPVED